MATMTLPPRADDSAVELKRQTDAKLQRTYDTIAAPFKTWGDLADERRQFAMSQQAADSASQRRMKESQVEGDQALERRLKEEDKAASIRMLQQASSEGLPVDDKFEGNSGETAAYTAKLRNEERQRQANTGWSLISAQRDRLREDMDDSLTDLKRVAGDSSSSNPATRREALRAALADPSSKNISEKLRANLQKIANSDADPLTAVNEAVSRIQNNSSDNSGILYKTADTRANNAAAFLSAYNAVLAPKAAQEHQAQFLAANERYSQTLKGVEDLNHQMAAHLNTYGAHMDPDTFKSAVDTLKTSPGRKPPVFPTGAPTTSTTTPTAAPPVTAPPVSTPATGSPPIQSVSQGVDQGGIAGGINNAVTKGIVGAGDVVSGLADNSAAYFSPTEDGSPSPFRRDLTGAGGGRMGLNAQGTLVPSPTQQQILANRSNVDIQIARTATQAEISALPQFAKSIGVSDADIAKGTAGAQANDPTALASLGKLIRLYRQAQQSGGNGIPMTSSAPVGGAVTAPPVIQQQTESAPASDGSDYPDQ